MTYFNRAKSAGFSICILRFLAALYASELVDVLRSNNKHVDVLFGSLGYI